MGLSGSQRQQLQEALIDAFPDKASLERMLSFELNKNLDAIASGTSLSYVVFQLIKKAEAENWVEDLINGARRANPGNQKLKDVANGVWKDSQVKTDIPQNLPYSLVTKLNNAKLQGEEGDRKTGSFYTFNVWLDDVCLEKSQDFTENNCHIQQYTIKGKWNSKVYKEINAFGLRVDKPWGVNKKPHGNFTVAIEILNGRATQIKVDTVRYDDSANNYAADKAKQLINSKTSEFLRIF